MTHLLCLNICGADYDSLYGAASPARQARAERYLHREDALRCLAAEALLRHAVKQELGLTEFSLGTGPQGKPCVAGAEGFHFNLSHAGDWVVLAWGKSPVGVDVEKIRWDEKKEALARRFFTPEEQDYVFRQAEGREKRFFEIWTAKESYLKYLGTGLQKSLNSFNALALEERLYQTTLDGGYCLTVCSQEEDILCETLP